MPKAPKPNKILRFCILLLVVLFTACPPPPPTPTPPSKPPPAVVPPPVLQRLTPAQLPLFGDDLDYQGLDNGIAMSLVYLKRLPAGQNVAFGTDRFSVAQMIRTLEAFRALVAERPDLERLNQVLGQRFRVYRAAGNDQHGTVLYTGYYEPTLDGSAKPGPRFPVPIHSRPSDLVTIDLSLFAPDLRGRRITGRYTGHTVVPYPERSLIRSDPDFDRLAPPIAWLHDPVDLLILQIQGSGKVRLQNGQELQVQFDGSNGQPYRSIGRLLIAQGKITVAQMSMQAIRTYLRNNPREVDAILDHNPRYIFFRRASRGPFGALGVPLTPRRSIAIDRRIFPAGALAYVATPMPQTDPAGHITGWGPYGGFVLAQDTGSAITGPGRVDLFMGDGLEAEVAAGHLKHEGALYFLVLKTDEDPP